MNSNGASRIEYQNGFWAKVESELGLVKIAVKVYLNFLGLSASASLANFDNEEAIGELVKLLQDKKESFHKYCADHHIESQLIQQLSFNFVDHVQIKMIAARIKSDGIRRYLPEDTTRSKQSVDREQESVAESLNSLKL